MYICVNDIIPRPSLGMPVSFIVTPYRNTSIVSYLRILFHSKTFPFMTNNVMYNELFSVNGVVTALEKYPCYGCKLIWNKINVKLW